MAMDLDLRTMYLAGLETLSKAKARALAGQPLSTGEALAVIRFAEILRNELGGYRNEPQPDPTPIPSPPKAAPVAAPTE